MSRGSSRPRRFAATLLVFLLPLLALAGAARPARAQLWFDGGRPDTVVVRAAGDSSCFELFPPWCMGPLPPRSYVWEKIELLPCAELRWADQLCWNGAFVRGARIEFNDGGCGCGGYVEIPTTLRLSYDPAAVAALGLLPGQLRLIMNDATSRAWLPVEGARVRADEACLEAPALGKILGTREYAIVGPAFTPTRATTWGGLKALYDGR